MQSFWETRNTIYQEGTVEHLLQQHQYDKLVVLWKENHRVDKS